MEMRKGHAGMPSHTQGNRGRVLALCLGALLAATMPFATAFAASYAIDGSDTAEIAAKSGAKVDYPWIMQAEGGSLNNNVFTVGERKKFDLSSWSIGTYGNTEVPMSGNEISFCYGVASDLYGAYNDWYDHDDTGVSVVTGNTVIIRSYSVNTADHVYGGYSSGASADRNTAEVHDGTFNVVVGGRGRLHATNNNVIIKAGTFEGVTNYDMKYAVVGGYANEGNAAGNVVTIDWGFFKGDIWGGFSSKKDAVDNTVVIHKMKTFTEAANAAIVYGGYSDQGSAHGNTVIWNDGEIGYVYGAYGSSCEGNKVILNGGSVTKYLYGAYGRGSATGNSVTVNGGAVGSVYGGYARGGGDVLGNTVTVNGGSVCYVYGAEARGEYAEAANNTVIIKGGTISGSVLCAQGNKVHDNTVHVYSDVAGSVSVADPQDSFGNAYNNTMYWYAGNIGGEIAGKQGEMYDSANNTLMIYGNGLTGGSINRFDTVNFYLGRYGARPVGGDTIVTLTGAANVSDKKLQVAGIIPGSLKTGDSVVLLKAASNDGTPNFAEAVEVREGFSRKRTVYQAWDSATSTFTATLGDKKKGLLEETKSLTEASALSMAVVTSTVDAMMGEGMKNAKTATQVASETGTGKQFSPFAYLGTGKMRYKTGSHVDSKDIGMGIGFVKSVETERGTLTFGPAVSYGYATYDSYLDGGTHASGNAKALGISFFVKQERKDGLYVEGSLGAGKIKTTYESADLATSYDTDAPYYAAHVGVGKVNKLSDRLTLDAYAKYMYSHQNANEATLTSGETYRFDNISSHRIRLGARMENAYRAENSIYYGVAWEHEFGGDARATFDGDSTPSPSLKGSSALLELGWKAKASKTSNLNADLFVNGWLGKKEGISFGANLCWEL